MNLNFPDRLLGFAHRTSATTPEKLKRSDLKTRRVFFQMTAKKLGYNAGGRSEDRTAGSGG
jgi:hypothetical protein